jgi:hypothetical protein
MRELEQFVDNSPDLADHLRCLRQSALAVDETKFAAAGKPTAAFELMAVRASLCHCCSRNPNRQFRYSRSNHLSGLALAAHHMD